MRAAEAAGYGSMLTSVFGHHIQNNIHNNIQNSLTFDRPLAELKTLTPSQGSLDITLDELETLLNAKPFFSAEILKNVCLGFFSIYNLNIKYDCETDSRYIESVKKKERLINLIRGSLIDFSVCGIKTKYEQNKALAKVFNNVERFDITKL